MKRFFRTLILALIIFAGGWLLYHRGQIHSFSDALRLAQSELGVSFEQIPGPFYLAGDSHTVPDRRDPGIAQDYSAVPVRQTSTPLVRGPLDSIASAVADPTVRIASFKLDSETAGDGQLLAADICGQFDVVAIQNMSGLNISRLVNDLNQRGFGFRFVDQAGDNQKLVILFDQQTVLLEEQHWYTVNDPDNLFQHKPLVAWFRARNAPDHLAFTFTLVNLQLNPNRPDQEIAWLSELFRVVRADGREEDDIILAGDFHSSDVQLNEARPASILTAAIVATATNTRNDRQLDNIVFDRQATVEFTGASGTFDFMQRFNLTLAEALTISSRMPVWAEFSAIEGHSPGRAFERQDEFSISR